MTGRVRRAIMVWAIALAALVTSGHIGDSNTHFRGQAGPYAVRVTIRHPGVVPGLADITVRVEGGFVRRVTVQPVPARQGFQGAPRPDDAAPVPGKPGLWAAELWFMESGSYSVHVAVEGDEGAGSVVVPVASIATRRLDLGPGLGILLLGLGLFLAVGLVSIVRAAVGDAVLAPGEVPDAARIRRARTAAAVSAVVLIVLLTGARAWWGAEDAAYQARMFRPLGIDAQLAQDPAGPVLRIALGDGADTSSRFSPIVPDHGKLMHAFLVRHPDGAAFAHIHPAATAADSFHASLPALPAGTYLLYADIVHESGFAQTLVDTIEVSDYMPAARTTDPDDAWWNGTPEPAPSTGGSAEIRFADGTTLVRQTPAEGITAGEDVTLRFAARERDGRPTILDAYMGMPAHAAVRRDDDGVFVHLHPSGSISSAAQEQLTRILGLADDAPYAGHATTSAADAGIIEIPYAFPSPGHYRVYVQTKRAGTVRTAAFDFVVADRR